MTYEKLVIAVWRLWTWLSLPLDFTLQHNDLRSKQMGATSPPNFDCYSQLLCCRNTCWSRVTWSRVLSPSWTRKTLTADCWSSLRTKTSLDTYTRYLISLTAPLFCLSSLLMTSNNVDDPDFIWTYNCMLALKATCSFHVWSFSIYFVVSAAEPLCRSAFQILLKVFCNFCVVRFLSTFPWMPSKTGDQMWSNLFFFQHFCLRWMTCGYDISYKCVQQSSQGSCDFVVCLVW